MWWSINVSASPIPTVTTSARWQETWLSASTFRDLVTRHKSSKWAQLQKSTKKQSSCLPLLRNSISSSYLGLTKRLIYLKWITSLLEQVQLMHIWNWHIKVKNLRPKLLNRRTTLCLGCNSSSYLLRCQLFMTDLCCRCMTLTICKMNWQRRRSLV